MTEKFFSSVGKHQNGTSAAGAASAGAARASVAASVSAGYKNIGQETCNMSNPALMSKIKERICEMDLVTQMDKAKELTHFALTHQAISKEDKE